MGVLDFLKKSASASQLAPIPLPVAPVTRSDDKLPRLPPLPMMTQTKEFPKTPSYSLPPMFRDDKPITSVATAPPLPSLPKLDDLPKIFVPRTEAPKIAPTVPVIPITPRVELKVEQPKPRINIPETPQEVPKSEPRVSEKLQKVLEELSVDDFDLPELEKFEPGQQDKFEPMLSRMQRSGPIFVTIGKYEEVLIQMKMVQNHLAELQARNEKLGVIETHTKNYLDNLIGSFDNIQKMLLAADEKLFKVN